MENSTSSCYLHFCSYGELMIQPNDVGQFVQILSRAQTCSQTYQNAETHYSLKPKILLNFNLIPASMVSYPVELKEAVRVIRETINSEDSTNSVDTIDVPF